MADARIPTHLWVGAKLRRCSAEGTPAVVVHGGERMGGTVMLKIYQPGVGCRLLGQIRDLDGRLGWYKAHKDELVAEPEADALIARAVERDPDLWVIEVETRDGRHPFEDIWIGPAPLFLPLCGGRNCPIVALAIPRRPALHAPGTRRRRIIEQVITSGAQP